MARLEPELGPVEGQPVALDGGITNRNYKVRLGGSDYVIRCPSKNTLALGIDRVSERDANEAAARLGTAPRVAAFLADEGCLVTEFIDGRTLERADMGDDTILAELSRALRAFHDGPPLPNAFDTLEITAAYRATLLANGGTLPDGYEHAAATMQRVADAVAGHPEHEPAPCHNDLLLANFIHDGERVRIIDWEYAGMGDRYFDLANLAVNVELAGPGEERLLAAYWNEPATDERLAALRLMKLMSDFREAMWGYLQAALAGDDHGFDYAAYGDTHLDRLLKNSADARFADWLEAAGGD